MHRLTARLLLFFAIVGNLVPLALATGATSPHACCLRKGVHRCHESAASESTELVVRAAGCCNQDCCRAVTTAPWAHTQQPATNFVAREVEAYLGQRNLSLPKTEVSRFQSTRAPPALRNLS